MTRLADITAVHWQPALGALDTIVEGADDIAQAIAIILRTPKGADPHRPEFGSNLHLYLDWPIDQARPHVVREVFDAISRWEPRAELVEARLAADVSQLTVRVVFKVGNDVFQAGVAL